MSKGNAGPLTDAGSSGWITVEQSTGVGRQGVRLATTLTAVLVALKRFRRLACGGLQGCAPYRALATFFNRWPDFAAVRPFVSAKLIWLASGRMRCLCARWS